MNTCNDRDTQSINLYYSDRLLYRMDLVGKSGQRFTGRLKHEQAMKMIVFFEQNEKHLCVEEDYQI